MKKIVIIEDEPDIAKFVNIRIKNAGFETFVCEDGQSGLNKVKEIKPDLLVLDLKLPDIPGEEICRTLKRDSEFENLPVIMLTAKTMDVDRIVGKVVGADCYMEKPFDCDRLISKIKELLKIT